MTPLGFLHLFAAVSYLNMALLLLARDMRSLLNRTCALMFVGFSSWSLCFVFIHNPATSRDTASLLLNISSLGGVSHPGLFVYLALVFSQKRRLLSMRLLPYLLLAPAAVLIATQWLGSSIVAVAQSGPESYGWRTVLRSTPWTYMYYAYAYGGATAALYMMFQYGFRSGDEVKKKQALIMVGSAVAAIVVNGAAALTSEWLGGPVPYVLDIAFLVWAVGLVWANVRYGLFSFEPVAAAHNIIETMSEVVLTVDTGGVIRDVNPAVTKMCGARRRDVIGHRLCDFLGRHPSEFADTKQLVEAGTIASLETVCSSPSGQRHAVRFSSSVLRDIDRRIQGIVCIIHDITEERRLETQIVEMEGQEQLRIGHDLHDGLGQHLTGTAFRCKALEQKLRGGKPIKPDDMAQVTELVNQAAEQVHLLARGLSPVTTRGEGLISALADLADSTRSMFGVSCRFDSDGKVRIDNEVLSTHLFRIAQEAVSNAARHAQAEQVVVSLKRAGQKVELCVEDNGVGVVGAVSEGEGMGMRTMRYRARIMGGTLDIHSRKGGGTIVRCTVMAPQEGTVADGMTKA